MLSDSAKTEIKALMAKYPDKRSAIMPVLHLVQAEVGWLPDEAIRQVADLLGLTSTEVNSVATFYTMYAREKPGQHTVFFCTDLPCALRGADKFLADLCGNLGIQVGETTPDGLITLEAVTCLAGCDKAPMFQIQSGNGLEYHENMSVDKTMELVAALRKSGKEVK